METINEIHHLRRSGFGRPRPRHGLKLLYWFANEYIYFDENNEMRSKYDPDEGYFGFHHFENRYYQSGERLLPDVNIPYYVVGNLNSRGADQLPSYVSDDHSPNNNDDDDSNTDRIIVSVDDEDSIERVYVTQHIDTSNYDPDATFRISKGLLMNIRRKNLELFQGSVQAASLDVSLDVSASLFSEHPVNVYNQPLTPPSSLTPQTITTSNVTVDLSANSSSELDDDVDKEHPPNVKNPPDIYIPMGEDFEGPRMTCWRNCAIL